MCSSTPEHGCDERRDQTSSINGQVEDGEEGASLLLLLGTASSTGVVYKIILQVITFLMISSVINIME